MFSLRGNKLLCIWTVAKVWVRRTQLFGILKRWNSSWYLTIAWYILNPCFNCICAALASDWECAACLSNIQWHHCHVSSRHRCRGCGYHIPWACRGGLWPPHDHTTRYYCSYYWFNYFWWRTSGSLLFKIHAIPDDPLLAFLQYVLSCGYSKSADSSKGWGSFKAINMWPFIYHFIRRLFCCHLLQHID